MGFFHLLHISNMNTIQWRITINCNTHINYYSILYTSISTSWGHQSSNTLIETLLLDHGWIWSVHSILYFRVKGHGHLMSLKCSYNNSDVKPKCARYTFRINSFVRDENHQKQVKIRTKSMSYLAPQKNKL